MRAVGKVHRVIFECGLFLVQPEISSRWWGTEDNDAG
jgi:hypothetical protein